MFRLRPRLRKKGRLREVSYAVGGAALWFRVENVPPVANSLPGLCAMWLPLLRDGGCLQTQGRVPGDLKAGLGHIAKLGRRWWGYDGKVLLTHRWARPRPSRTAGRRGLFFSCGVDSFHALLTAPDEVDDLILVHGFDVPLSDPLRFAKLREHATAVADALGKGLVVVETNLQEHPVTGSVCWGKQMHGAAMAAVAHLLARHFSVVRIAASYPWTASEPWGSTAAMDPLWSSSKGVVIEHVGDAEWRTDKLRGIHAHPLVRKHLQVCWSGQGEMMHCGKCEKCLRTQVALLTCQAPGGMESMPELPPEVLAARIDALPPLSRAVTVYQRFLEAGCLPPSVHTAVARLIHGGTVPPERVSKEGWTPRILACRVDPSRPRTRHAGGSPDAREIEAYGAGLGRPPHRVERLLVLGMTPELRALAAQRADRWWVADRNEASIRLYANWISDADRARESIQRVDWLSLSNHVPPMDAVLGDGVFGNLAGVDAHRALLRSLRRVLRPHGRVVIRKAVVRSEDLQSPRNFQHFLEEFRAGRLDEAEFGFCSRLAGFLDRDYCPYEFRLKNASIYKRLDTLHAQGVLHDPEARVLQRYRFEEDNCILTRCAWESLLRREGWDFERVELKGKRWYGMYPIYICRPGAVGGGGAPSPCRRKPNKGHSPCKTLT